MYEHYATFSFPAHTRVASGPESPAPAVATLSGPPATLRAETEPFCSPGAARGVGLMGEVDPGRSCKRRGARTPSLRSPQSERPYLPSPAGACKCSPPSGLRKRPSLFTAGEPPCPVPLGRAHQASGRAPQLQVPGQPFPRSWHAGSEAPGPPAPPACSPSSPDRHGGDAVDKPALDGIAHKVEALSATTTAATIAATGPDPAWRPEPGTFGRSTGKRPLRIAHNGLERLGPCPDTREIGRSGRCAAGVGAGPRAVLRYATNVPRAPAHPWPSRPERQPLRVSLVAPSPPPDREGQAMRAADAAPHGRG